MQQLQETSTMGQISGDPLMLRDIQDPLTWVACFLAFVVVREMRELMAYGKIMLLLASKHGGLEWTVYNQRFRLLAAAGGRPSWTEIILSL